MGADYKLFIITDSIMRIAWFSDLGSGINESRTSFATKYLLPYLKTCHEIDLFCEATPSINYNTPVFHYLTAFERHKNKPYDNFLYLIESTDQSAFVRTACGLLPGILWFFDYMYTVLPPKSLIHSPYLDLCRWQTDHKLFTRKEEPNHYPPHSQREIGLASAILSTSQWWINEIPHHFQGNLLNDKNPHVQYCPTPIPYVDKRSKAKKIEHIGIVGTPRIEHRSIKILTALSEIDPPLKITWLLDPSEIGHANFILQDFPNLKVEIKSPRNPSNWNNLSNEFDLTIHLLFSNYHSLSPYFEISLMNGIPTICLDFGEPTYLPDSITLKISAGEFEVSELKLAILQLRNNPSIISNLSEAGYEYASSLCNASIVATELSCFLSDTRDRTQSAIIKWNEMHNIASKEFQTEISKIYQDNILGEYFTSNITSPFINWCNCE